jgi:hypothetical protein
MQAFLATKAPAFMADLWKLLIEAQANPLGVPQSMIEEFKRQEANKPSIRMGSRFDAGPPLGDSGGRGPHDRRNDRGDGYGDRGRGGGERGRRRGRGRGGYQGGEGRYGDRHDDHEVCIFLSLADLSLLMRFSSEVLQDAVVLQGTVPDRDHPLDGIVPDLTLQDCGADLLLIPQGHAPRTDAVTNLHHLGVVGTPIAQGHALGLHTVMVGEGALPLAGEVGVRPRQGLPEVCPSASDAVAMLPRSTPLVLEHLPGVLPSKIAVGRGRRLGPGPDQGHPLGRGRCAVPPHLAGVLVEVRVRTRVRGHRTCAASGRGAALLGTALKNPGLHL